MYLYLFVQIDISRDRVITRSRLIASTRVSISISPSHDEMFQYDKNRIEYKRRAGIDFRKRQFATATYKEQEYSHRLNLYEIPPTAEITLEQFEQWAIDRLKGIIVESFYSNTRAYGLYSSSRTRGMLIPEQDPRRNGRTYESPS